MREVKSDVSSLHMENEGEVESLSSEGPNDDDLTENDDDLTNEDDPVNGNKELDHPTQVNESTIAIGCWKGRASLIVMVTAIDCKELLERLLMRKEPENGSSAQGEESNVEANKVQDSNDIEKNEHAESIKLATSS